MVGLRNHLGVKLHALGRGEHLRVLGHLHLILLKWIIRLLAQVHLGPLGELRGKRHTAFAERRLWRQNHLWSLFLKEVRRRHHPRLLQQLHLLHLLLAQLVSRLDNHFLCFFDHCGCYRRRAEIRCSHFNFCRALCAGRGRRLPSAVDVLKHAVVRLKRLDNLWLFLRLGLELLGFGRLFGLVLWCFLRLPFGFLLRTHQLRQCFDRLLRLDLVDLLLLPVQAFLLLDFDRLRLAHVFQVI